jgi:glycosyltransferase involved in cell wall biosynthesis
MSKIKLLAWSDSASVSTGFGVVSRHVLTGLQNTGKYSIHHLAINHDGRFDDRWPWQQQPAKLMEPNDPYGNKMLLRTLMKEDYDILWILNDNYVTTEVSKAFNDLRERKKKAGKKMPLVVYYYPVDCQVIKEGAGMVEQADICVAYTNHGRAESLKTLPHIEKKLYQIPHGVDTKNFRPLPPNRQAALKRKYFNCDADTYAIINVNRNSARKQIPYTLLAFKEFRKHVPNSILYLHTAAHDQGGDLLLATRDLGFNTTKDVIYPVNYTPGNGVPDEILNEMLNASDMFFSTHLGEGWGLTITEAMATGLPVVIPNNTCMPQLVGDNEERGYMYECKDTIWIDNSGYRPKGNLDDIVEKMLEAYNAGSKYENQKTKKAILWCKEHDWRKIAEQWIELFKNLEGMEPGKPQISVDEA